MYLRNGPLNPSMMVVMMRMSSSMLGMTEDQRLDHHRYRLRVGKLLADVDKIEIFEINAIDRDNAGTRNELTLDNVAH